MQPTPLASALPRMHHPHARIPVAEHGGWEVRAWAWNDERHAWLARHGLLHLQLWHPGRAISVLTPSRATAGKYEVHAPHLDVGAVGPPGRWRCCCVPHLTELVRRLGAPLCPSMVRHYETWLIHAALIGRPQVPEPA